jgi:hypothetical protein
MPEEQLGALARCLGNPFACLVPVAKPTAAGSQEDTDRETHRVTADRPSVMSRHPISIVTHTSFASSCDHRIGAGALRATFA